MGGHGAATTRSQETRSRILAPAICDTASRMVYAPFTDSWARSRSPLAQGGPELETLSRSLHEPQVLATAPRRAAIELDAALFEEASHTIEAIRRGFGHRHQQLANQPRRHSLVSASRVRRRYRLQPDRWRRAACVHTRPSRSSPHDRPHTLCPRLKYPADRSPTIRVDPHSMRDTLPQRCVSVRSSCASLADDGELRHLPDRAARLVVFLRCDANMPTRSCTVYMRQFAASLRPRRRWRYPVLYSRAHEIFRCRTRPS